MNLRPFGPEPFIRDPRETPLSLSTCVLYRDLHSLASSCELAPRIARKRGSFECRGVVRGSGRKITTHGEQCDGPEASVVVDIAMVCERNEREGEGTGGPLRNRALRVAIAPA